MKVTIHKILRLSHLMACACVIVAVTASISLAVSTMKVRNGVMYPKSGDSLRSRISLDKEMANNLQPGMMIGVLPSNCNSASKGSYDKYYSCAHNVYLQPIFNGDEVVYRVIERP